MNCFAFAILIIAAVSIPAQAKYSGGSGEPNDPYQIASVADLLTLAADTNDYNKCFILTADIDLDPNLPGNKVFTTAVIAPDIDNSDWDFQGIAFTGDFNGNSHIISNLTIDTGVVANGHLGLFGCIGYIGETKNLVLENINIIGGERSYIVGGLVGWNSGSTSNCHSTGFVSAGDYSGGIGGLAGWNSGSISHCHSTVFVSAGDFTVEIGGLVGWNDHEGDINDCYSTGAVRIGNFSLCFGGLVGDNFDNISNCYSTSSVIAGDNSGEFGGLVGCNSGNINDCYSTGSVSSGNSSEAIGGLVGRNYYEGDTNNCYSTSAVSSGDNSICIGGLVGCNDYEGNINDCYSTGSVSSGNSSETIGGLVGFNYLGSICNCYSIGTVTGGVGSSYLGGLAGYSWGSINSCYFLVTSGPDNGFGTPLADEEMKQQTSFVDWDFITPVWTIIEGVDYPHLWWENTAPVADAGPDQTAYAWIDGIAEVNLDGSSSFDEDGDELTYSWSWTIDANSYEANGVNPSIELPVGQHVISLIVNDGIVDSEPNEVNITVIGPIEANLCVMPKVLNCRSNQPRITTVLRLPKGITKDQIDTNQPILLYPGEIEADKVWIIRGFDNKCRALRTTIFASFDKDDLMDAIPNNGLVELVVVGQLKTGQYFLGTDNIRVICPGHRPRHRPWCDHRWNRFCRMPR